MAAQAGVRGLVTAAGQPVAAATVEVEGIAKHLTTSERGEYWRLLAQGTYRSVLFYNNHDKNNSKNQKIYDSIRATSGTKVSAWVSVTVGDLASKQQVRLDLELTDDQQGSEGGSLASRNYPRKYPNDYDEVHTRGLFLFNH